MENFFKELLENDLQDLKGLKVDCEIPLKDNLVSGAILEYLNSMDQKSSDSNGDEVEYLRLFRKYLKDIDIKMNDGKAVVKLSLYVD